MATKICEALQKSVGFCEGSLTIPGIRRTIYYTAKSNIVKAPVLPEDENGRPTSMTLEGDYELKADAVFHKIEGIPNKNQYTSEAQGELYSQTQNNKLTFFYPSTNEEGSSLCVYLNNTANVVIFEDNNGKFRVLRNEHDLLKAEITQDSGQTVTGETGTTVTFTDTDKVFPPFFSGSIPTDDGIISLGGTAAGGTGN